MRGDRKRKLSFFYDLKRLAAAVKPRRDYEVTALPGGDEVRISRTFDGVKYNIIFEGGDSLSFEYAALPDGLNEPAALLSGVMDTARPPWR